MKKYWYFISTYECPLCGSGETYRERRYTEKPIAASMRYAFKYYYDYCDV